MVWYDIPIIFVGVIGLLLIIFSSYDNRKMMYWGVILIIAALIVKASIWFAGLV